MVAKEITRDEASKYAKKRFDEGEKKEKIGKELFKLGYKSQMTKKALSNGGVDMLIRGKPKLKTHKTKRRVNGATKEPLKNGQLVASYELQLRYVREVLGSRKDAGKKVDEVKTFLEMMERIL